MEMKLASPSVVVFFVLMIIQGAYSSTTFIFKNNCPYTVWPAALSSAGAGYFPTTGFQLDAGRTSSLDSSPVWSGRIWARTGCTTDSATNKFTCQSGDCGSGKVECDGKGGNPPATLAEFTLSGHDGKDFYDTSLVDGYNVPMSIAPQGVDGCNATACSEDINQRCPEEMLARGPDGKVAGCRSPCLAFGEAEYCCTGKFNDPKVCKPTKYSKIFKDACPQAYSYPYDDATSTFTCFKGEYMITFCP